jgi:uncharacterized membrane protein
MYVDQTGGLHNRQWQLKSLMLKSRLSVTVGTLVLIAVLCAIAAVIRDIRMDRRYQMAFTLICGFLAAAIAVPTLDKTFLSGCLVLCVTVVGYILGKKVFG